MARQDVNQALLQTSFLYGANSAYIEALQAQYEKDPLSVEPGWREFFDALGDDPASVVKTARGASWRKPNWPPTAKGDLISALDGDWPATEQAVADKLRAKAAEAGPKAAPSEDEIRRATRDSVRALMMIRAYRMRGHLYANLDPLGLEPQRDHEELHPSTYGFQEFGLRPPDLHRSRARARIFDRARNARDPAANLLRHDRLRIRPYFRSGGEGVDSGARRGARQGNPVHPGGQARDPWQADRGRGVREFLRRQIYRREALWPRRGGSDDSGARADHQARRPAWLEGDRSRHGPSRTAQRALPGDGQAAPRHFPRIQGRLGFARSSRRLRRRQISPRRVLGPRIRRQQRSSLAHRQSVASRDRRSRSSRQGPRQAGSASRRHRAHEGAAAPDPRRRRFRRTGRGGRMLRPLGPARPPDRRLAAFHRQQPDRLYHLPALFSFLALSIRRRQAGRGADLPCQRR